MSINGEMLIAVLDRIATAMERMAEINAESRDLSRLHLAQNQAHHDATKDLMEVSLDENLRRDFRTLGRRPDGHYRAVPLTEEDIIEMGKEHGYARARYEETRIKQEDAYWHERRATEKAAKEGGKS